MLKAVLSKAEVDALPVDVRPLYLEKDGQFTIQIEGMTSPAEVQQLKNKIAEFRDTNVNVLRERDDLKNKLVALEGIDPIKYKEMSTEIETLKSRGINKPDDIQAAIDKANKPILDKLAAAEKREQDAQAKIRQTKFVEAIRAEATKAGINPTAMKHVERDAAENFELGEDDQIVPKKGVKHPTEPHKDFTPPEWLKHLAVEQPFLFAPSQGGGAQGREGGGNGNGNQRPGVKILRNPTSVELGQHTDDLASGKAVVVRN